MADFKLSEEGVRELREISEPPHPYPINFYDLFYRKESPDYGGLR